LLGEYGSFCFEKLKLEKTNTAVIAGLEKEDLGTDGTKKHIKKIIE